MRKILLTLVFLSLSAFANQNFEQSLTSCITKSNENACKVVTDTLEAKCYVGDRVSCFFLADILGRGLGISKDVVRSYKMFKKQCEQGSSEACYELSVKYLQGNGTEHSFDLSAAALEKACKLGSKRACDVLALVPNE
ncbi:sel1 repeat family protein [Campylobacter sp. RM9344]|uniref:beta-lactamase n=1 Tax=Campylobacter californiensis TaxID=1032243 RepID=A0AAW3ZUU2_9BACT|nr:MULTISPECIES: tetratricopeptide repeat protein [unclassified Campylobacter]MBE2984475.1 sel1 repeat family protein [Campylobacter sp. RM6883]MBE2994995.1 sel1 repeat family protein [Campylobacter sp. RM6913]MBE3028916.1 sel1 repeat family protein [Campylobacter sp. RM9344]MBE3607274.1 sel1 repeat family protein [Campylobacter sp. RM9337]QCD50182.1 Sel1 domain repeat-containing protein [Campylobacter sp. RM6914]